MGVMDRMNKKGNKMVCRPGRDPGLVNETTPALASLDHPN
jgi:hypothetical protein